VSIRELTAADVPFLRQMLCDALFWSRRRRRLRWLGRLVLRLEIVAIYHRGWGRAGDTGFVAENNGRPTGAVWYRFFTEEEHGDGYVDPQTPELAIAVVESHRGRGIGGRLMEAIHDRARETACAASRSASTPGILRGASTQPSATATTSPGTARAA
jgi:GNAT superfamily N-acetyltransferase